MESSNVTEVRVRSFPPKDLRCPKKGLTPSRIRVRSKELNSLLYEREELTEPHTFPIFLFSLSNKGSSGKFIRSLEQPNFNRYPGKDLVETPVILL